MRKGGPKLNVEVSWQPSRIRQSLCTAPWMPNRVPPPLIPCQAKSLLPTAAPAGLGYSRKQIIQPSPKVPRGFPPDPKDLLVAQPFVPRARDQDLRRPPRQAR